jgi:alkylation response protein AidB-like acyl-CoA dehydrogenase
MDLTFSEEQRELRDVVRRFLGETSAESAVRQWMDRPGYDVTTWHRMASELGLQSMAIPEQYGGMGGGYVDLAVVFEELGRALTCVPFFATIGLAANALLCSDDEAAKEEYLGELASGALTATLALTEDSGRWDKSAIGLTAARGNGEWVLTGHKSYVIDGTTAGLVLVPARTAGGITLFAVREGARGLKVTELSGLDATRKQARVEFHSTPGRLLGSPGEGWPATERALALAAVALAAEQVGAAQHVLEMTVDYARKRYQFGRAIGSFQAIKHKCVDMLLEIEGAKSAAYAAARAAEANAPDLRRSASLAKVSCSDAFMHAAADCIQIHGGIGFTWEHSAHLYYRRAKSSELYLGDSRYHRQIIAACLNV